MSGTSGRRTPQIAINDLPGAPYMQILERLHEVLDPASYFEIGTDAGRSLALSQCPSIAIDPDFDFVDPEVLRTIITKPAVSFFNMTSDAFFAAYDPSAILGRPIDMAFLDGMHRCEFLLRDFINVERHCKRNSVVILHDCVPAEEAITAREQPEGSIQTVLPHRHNWWVGDVWRTALLLKRARPDLMITTLDAQPSGLVLITNLDPDSETLAQGYATYVARMMSWRLSELGIDGLLEEMGIESTSALSTDEQITARFWL